MARERDRSARDRAHGACEYCRFPERFSEIPFVWDHVIARQHGGTHEPGNLALCCGFCNRHKGPNIAGIDSRSGRVTRLFNPRQDAWSRHFRLSGPYIVGKTAIGRTTVQVLAMNYPDQILVRAALIAEGVSFEP